MPAGQALAVEDSVPGARSAVAAGIRTVGNLTFVPPQERDARRWALVDAGVVSTMTAWDELAAMLIPAGSPRR